MGEKRGRKPEPSRDELRADILVQRMQQAEAAEQAASYRPMPYPNRLFHLRKLTRTQLSAVDLVGRTYRVLQRYSKYVRLQPKSQSFEFTTAGGDAFGDLEEDDKQRLLDAKADWDRIKPCVPSIPREAWDHVLTLCVFESHVPDIVLPDLRIVLDRIAQEFDIGLAVELKLRPPGRMVFPTRQQVAPSIVPALKPTRSKKPKLSRDEKFEKNHYAARTDDAKPQKPSQLTGDAAKAAARDREGLERTLRARQAQKEGATP